MTTEKQNMDTQRKTVLKIKRSVIRGFRDLNETMRTLAKRYGGLKENLADLEKIVGKLGMERYYDREMPYGLTTVNHIDELLNALTPLVNKSGKPGKIIPRIRVIDHDLYLQLTHDGVNPIKASPLPGFVPPNLSKDVCRGFLPGGCNVVKKSYAAVYDVARRLYESQARQFDENDGVFQNIISELWTAMMEVAIYVEEHNNHKIREMNEQFKKIQQTNKRLSTLLKKKGIVCNF